MELHTDQEEDALYAEQDETFMRYTQKLNEQWKYRVFYSDHFEDIKTEKHADDLLMVIQRDPAVFRLYLASSAAMLTNFATVHQLVPEGTAEKLKREAFLLLAREEDPNQMIEIILQFERDMRHMKELYATKTFSPVVSQAVEYIHRNLQHRISTADIAEAIHVSAAYLSSIFHKEIGVTCMQYVNKLKMQYADALLKDGTRSKSEVASLLGFDSYPYFSRLYHAYLQDSESSDMKIR